jgi:hypothetical protein
MGLNIKYNICLGAMVSKRYTKPAIALFNMDGFGVTRISLSIIKIIMKSIKIKHNHT